MTMLAKVSEGGGETEESVFEYRKRKRSVYVLMKLCNFTEDARKERSEITPQAGILLDVYIF